MKVRVDPEICIGCTLCEQTCPAVFRMEGDKAVAYIAIVPKEHEAACKKAAEECPVSAINVENQP